MANMTRELKPEVVDTPVEAAPEVSQRLTYRGTEPLVIPVETTVDGQPATVHHTVQPGEQWPADIDPAGFYLAPHLWS
jgi:hypothetical protein